MEEAYKTFGELTQQRADEAGSLMLQGRAAHVDVVVGFLTGGQGDLAVNNGELLDALASLQGLLGDFVTVVVADERVEVSDDTDGEVVAGEDGVDATEQATT